VIFERNIDSKIIGGLILQIGDLRWDGSIASQLKKIRKEIIQGQTFRLN
jgi:F0F1-type ATP synthase delta subunit